ncbi:NADH-quinone oxidoreductase subunit NuoH [bacterium]|nr:NADH-quinone oxidoreductase subunit NuoH [bacterium]
MRALLRHVLFFLIALLRVLDRTLGRVLAPVLVPLFRVCVWALHTPLGVILPPVLMLMGAYLLAARPALRQELPDTTWLPLWSHMWIDILVAIVGIVLLGPMCMVYITWLERKLLGRFQNRYGPNRVGKYGLLQPFADGIKMLIKEDIVPRGADRALHFIAPVVIVVPPLVIFSVLPLGPGMSALPMEVGVLFFFALSGISGVAIFLAGWASHNKFSLLGGMRAVAQLVSYEVPLLLSVVVVIMVAGTLSTDKLVEAQTAGRWFVFTPWGLVGFLLFFTAGLAEVNRTPFDLPEAESELVAGFHTEYSGFKFALFYLAEFIAAVAIAGLTVTLFLGGWSLPGADRYPMLAPVVFLSKAALLVLVMVWFRGTFPRLRIDQVMTFSWKFLLPLALVNIIVAGIWIFLVRDGSWRSFGIGWAVGAIILIAFYVWLNRFTAPSTIEKRVYRFAEE